MAHVPQRTCVGCRARTDRSHLIRVVAGEGQPTALRLDLRGSLEGRGAHLHPALECLDVAERRRAFARALRITGPVDTSAVRRYLDDLAQATRPERVDGEGDTDDAAQRAMSTLK